MTWKQIRPYATTIAMAIAVLVQTVSLVLMQQYLKASLDDRDKAVQVATGFRDIADEWRDLALSLAAAPNARCSVPTGLRGSLL
jgi:hypothetical protein